MIEQTIYDFVKNEENAFQLRGVPITDNWEWKFYDHVREALLYKNSQYTKGVKGGRPFKNIIRSILNLQYRAEGFDVKDINIFVDDKDDYYKSLLVRKFHDKWARENDIDTFIDELVESYVDKGGALVKYVNDKRPEVVPLERIAFCDQTDILSGPIGEVHYYSPAELLKMSDSGWGDLKKGATMTLQDLITLSKPSKDVEHRKATTPGNYIKVYEVHGEFPVDWLKDDYDEEDEGKYSRQLHIISYYNDTQDDKKYVCLFKGSEKKSIYKVLLRDGIFGRALGLGGVEELTDDQIWTNYAQIREKELLDASSKVILQYAGDLKGKDKLSDVDNLEIIETEEGHRIELIQTTSVNLPLFERSQQEWESHAKDMGSATGALLGEQVGAGRMAYNSMALLTAQGQAIHEYRRGKIAVFVSEIYRDWILPYFQRELQKGTEFAADFDLDELQVIVENLIVTESNKIIIEKILNGEIIDPAEIETYKQTVKTNFMAKGKKRFVEMLKDEFSDLPIDIEISIMGKQKDLSGMITRMLDILQRIVAAPQILDDPRMSNLINQVIEESGLEPIDLSKSPAPPMQNATLPPPPTNQSVVAGLQNLQTNAVGK